MLRINDVIQHYLFYVLAQRLRQQKHYLEGQVYEFHPLCL